MKNIVIFASGSGTNAENLIRHFKAHPKGRIVSVFCNNKEAPVVKRALGLGVPVLIFGKEDLYGGDTVIGKLKELNTDLIILAGFLWLVPEDLIKEYSGKIVNIHPALLPGYGGKGMYGSRVHESIILNREKESGISIHLVNERFDEGEIIFQARCPVSPDDDAASLARKIHALEHEHFPRIVETLL
jgi:phosphoribosylglycinamide formyltransferase 1